MSLFKKNKHNKKTKAEDIELLDTVSTDSDISGLDGMFKNDISADIGGFDMGSDLTDEELQFIFDKFMSEDDAEDTEPVLEMVDDVGEDEKSEVEDVLLTIKENDGPSFNKVEEAGFEITDRVETVDEGLSEVVETYGEAVVDENIETIVEEPAEEAIPEEPRELTTDEAIEEFIKNVTLAGGISELFQESESVSEDGLEAPEFANGEEAPAEATLPPEYLAVPMGIDAGDLNEVQTDGVGSTDMNLRIAFGLEEEDDDSEEMKDAVKKMGDHFETSSRIGRQFQPDRPEFTDTTQARDIAGEYRFKMRSVTARMIFAILGTLVLLAYENIPVLTELIFGSPKQFAGILDPAVYPVIYIMVSLQILFIIAAFALPELRRGTKRLFKGVPTPESITVLALAVSAVASLVKAHSIDVTYVLAVYNSVAAMSVVMSLIYSRLNTKREMITFFIAGSKKRKYAMNRVPENETLIPREEYEEDMYGDVMRVERTGFIDGFFGRMCHPDGMTSAFTAAFMGIAIAVAILFGVFGDKGSSAVYSIANISYIVLLSVLPLSAHVTFSYPFYRAAKAASECDSAIVGETSLEEYAATAVVSFDDGNVFPSYGVKVQNIKIYNNARIDRVLYYASSAFKYAGGPLSDVFEVATMEMGRSENVQIVDADKGYLAAAVDGINIVFGSYPALIGKGFDIADSIAQDDVDFSDELSVMYMFREDMLIAKFYIKYVLDGDIEPILHQFQDYGMYLCVRTYDPNIDEDMICSKLQLRNPPVKVVRYRKVDDVRGVMEKVDSGFVTFGSPKSLLQLLPYCDKTIHTKRTCGALSVMAVIVSLMMLAVYAMSSGIDTLNSLYITVYHMIWVFFTYIASKLFIR